VNYTAGRHAGPDYGGGLAGMDLNYYNGSAEEMRAWLGLSDGGQETEDGQVPVPVVPVPGPPSPVVPPPVPGLPSAPPSPVSSSLAWLKPRYVKSGPAIIAGSDAPKANHPNLPLGPAAQTFIKQVNGNAEDVWKIFSDAFVGPSKGIDPDSGKLKYIVAGWSGNVVSILGRSGSWVKVACIDLSHGLPLASEVNHEKTPHLVHRMTTVNIRNQFISYPFKYGKVSAWDRLNDPLFSLNGEFWLPAEWIDDLATMTMPVNVRSGPAVTFPAVSSLPKGAKISVRAIARDAFGNKWGQIGAETWCCLEYQGVSYSSWRLF
jgi:hypothetical protein